MEGWSAFCHLATSGRLCADLSADLIAHIESFVHRNPLRACTACAAVVLEGVRHEFVPARTRVVFEVTACHRLVRDGAVRYGFRNSEESVGRVAVLAAAPKGTYVAPARAPDWLAWRDWIFPNVALTMEQCGPYVVVGDECLCAKCWVHRRRLRRAWRAWPR